MKLLTLIGLIICIPAMAQPDGWVQEDCGEGHVVICKQKKKVGIWSNARGEFIEPAHKGHVLHFPDAQIILDVYPKEKEVKAYHYYKGGIQELETPYPNGKFAFDNILAHQWNQKFDVKHDGYFFHYEDHDESDSAVYIGINPERRGHDNEDSLSYYFLGDYFIVKLSHENYENENPQVLLTVDNLDSVDENYNNVYEPEIIKTVYNSGVFNMKTGKWEIPPKYVRVVEWEGLYASYNWTYELENAVDSIRKTTYDFYQYVDKEGIKESSVMDYQKFAFPLELWPIENAKVWYDVDSTFIYSQTEKGTGLYQIPLTYRKIDKDGYSLKKLGGQGVYKVDEILAPIYDYAFLTGFKSQYEFPDIDMLFAIGSKGEDIFDMRYIDFFKSESDTLFEDVLMKNWIRPGKAYYYMGDTSYFDEHVYLVDDTTILRYEPYDKGNDLYQVKDWQHTKKVEESRLTFYVERAPNDMFVVNSWYEEDTYPYRALKSVIDDYDSLDANGNVVYEYNDPGSYNSGVFDGKKNSWLVPEKNMYVSYVKNGFLIEEPVFLEEKGTFRNIKTSRVSFVDADGNFVFKSKKPQDLYDDPKNYVYYIQGHNSKKTWPVDPTDKTTLYFETDQGIGCATIGYLNSSIHISPKDMVMYVYYHQILYAENNVLNIRFEGYRGRNNDTVEFKVPNVKGLKVQVNGPTRRIKSQTDLEFDNQETLGYQTSDFQCFVMLDDSLGCHYTSVEKGRAFSQFDTMKYQIPDLDPSLFWTTFADNEMKDNWELNLELLEGNRVYIRNRKKDDKIRVAMKSELDYYMDSIDVDGNVVYYPPERGYEASGVYNLETNKWEIAPKYMQILPISGDNFFIKAPIRKPDNYNLLTGYNLILKQGDNEKVLREEKFNEKYPEDYFDVGVINDSLVIINHYKPFKAATPYLSVVDELDSIGVDGNVVYAPALPAAFKSGVMNVYTDEWVISPQNQWVYLFDDSFVVVAPVLGENGQKSETFYHVYDLEGNSTKVGLSFDDLTPIQQEGVSSLR